MTAFMIATLVVLGFWLGVLAMVLSEEHDCDLLFSFFLAVTIVFLVGCVGYTMWQIAQAWYTFAI